jgi:hypothetical protein
LFSKMFQISDDICIVFFASLYIEFIFVDLINNFVMRRILFSPDYSRIAVSLRSGTWVSQALTWFTSKLLIQYPLALLLGIVWMGIVDNTGVMKIYGTVLEFHFKNI